MMQYLGKVTVAVNGSSINQPDGRAPAMSGIVKHINTRRLLAAMVLLQLLWVAAIWVTGATAATEKLLFLAIYTVVAGAVVGFLPEGALSRFRLWERNRRWPILILCLVFLVMGTFYATQQRLWDYDEEYAFTAAQVVADEGVGALFDDYANRPWLGKQHPPLIPIIGGLAVRLLGPHLVAIRLVSLLFAAASLLVTYLIGVELYDWRTGFLAALFLASFPLFLRLGTAGMVEMPLVFFFVLTLLLTLRLYRAPSPWLAAVTGLTIAAGLLTKYTMVFVFPIILGHAAVLGALRPMVKRFWALALLIVLLFAAWAAFAGSAGVLPVQLDTMITYASLVLTNRYGRELLFETITNRLPSSLGVYNIPLILMGGAYFLWRKRKSDWLILLWIGLVALPVSLTLPDHRYFMITFPAVAILMANTLLNSPKLAANKIIPLALLYGGGALYLFIDWVRASRLFLD